MKCSLTLLLVSDWGECEGAGRTSDGVAMMEHLSLEGICGSSEHRTREQILPPYCSPQKHSLTSLSL